MIKLRRMKMTADQLQNYQILALDVGQKRIGVARAASQVRLVEPLEIIQADGQIEFVRLQELLLKFKPRILVIGLPFDKEGKSGHQADLIKIWVKNLIEKTKFKGEIVYQDETLSSQAASKNSSKTGLVDDLAAGVILEDYLN